MRKCVFQLIPVLLLVCLALPRVYSSGDDAGLNRHRQQQTGLNSWAIHDQQLRETMLRLNALVAWSEQPGMPLDADSKAFLEDLLETVDDVAHSAQALKQAGKIEHLQNEQVAIYNTLADQLYNEAIAIDMNARNMRVEEMHAAFVNLNQVCIACHSLFRSL